MCTCALFWKDSQLQDQGSMVNDQGSMVQDQQAMLVWVGMVAFASAFQ